MRFIANEPALFHHGALIIGDTHFGIEYRLKEKGIHYQDMSEHILEKILSLIIQTKAKRLIILGDVKEPIAHVDAITERVFKKLQEKIPVTVVRGNHDGGIETICSDVKPSEGFVHHGLALIHGNAWPSERLMHARYLISAHQHPQIELHDASGKFHTESAWFISPPQHKQLKKFYKTYNHELRLILLPAFNPLAGKSFKSNSKTHLGPLFHNNLFKLDHAIVYKLDGTVLGKLKQLQK
jgi:hypothetical protein